MKIPEAIHDFRDSDEQTVDMCRSDVNKSLLMKKKPTDPPVMDLTDVDAGL